MTLAGAPTAGTLRLASCITCASTTSRCSFGIAALHKGMQPTDMAVLLAFASPVAVASWGADVARHLQAVISSNDISLILIRHVVVLSRRERAPAGSGAGGQAGAAANAPQRRPQRRRRRQRRIIWVHMLIASHLQMCTEFATTFSSFSTVG